MADYSPRNLREQIQHYLLRQRAEGDASDREKGRCHCLLCSINTIFLVQPTVGFYGYYTAAVLRMHTRTTYLNDNCSTVGP